MTVMIGVSLVGLSGSLAKNDAPDASQGVTQLLARAVEGNAPQEPATVFVGGYSHYTLTFVGLTCCYRHSRHSLCSNFVSQVSSRFSFGVLTGAQARLRNSLLKRRSCRCTMYTRYLPSDTKVSLDFPRSYSPSQFLTSTSRIPHSLTSWLAGIKSFTTRSCCTLRSLLLSPLVFSTRLGSA